MHTPTPHLDAARAPGGGLFQSGFHMGRVVAVHDDSDTVDIALHQGGLLRNVVVLSQLAGRHAAHIQLPPVTTGNGTATPTGADDTYAIIGYLQGKTIMPLVIGYLSPRDHALINRPAGASVRRDVGGQVSIAYPDGASEYVHAGGRVRLGETLDSPELDPSLIPPSDNPLQASFVNSVGVNIAIVGDQLNITAPGGVKINDQPSNDHAALDHLDYEDSGHTGFAPAEHSHDGYALADHNHESSAGFVGGAVDSESEFTSDLEGEQGMLRVALDTSRLWICRVAGEDRTWEPIGYLRPSDLPSEVDDHAAPDPPYALSSSWDAAQPHPDFTVSWEAPDRPADWLGYDVELRQVDQTVIRAANLVGDSTSYTWPLAVNLGDGGHSEIIAAVRSRDKWGNVSDWVELGAVYPIPAEPEDAPQLTTAFRTIQAAIIAADLTAAGAEIEFDRSLSGLMSMQLGQGSNVATCNAQTGETILVRYRYRDHFGRPTEWGPADSLIPATGEIQRFDLSSLEQEVITSNNGGHTAAQIAALRDGLGSVDAVTFAAGDRLTFDWPMPSKILGIILYASGAATPEWSLVYTDQDGNVLTLAANSSSDHTVAGSERSWLLRSYDGEVLDSYVAEALPIVGGLAYKEWHFGDDEATAASRAPKAITAQNLTLVFNAPVTLSEIRVLTYEAAQLVYARNLYLSEGAQIVNDDSDTGFIINTNYIQGLNAGLEVGKISAADGALWWKRGGFGGTSSAPKVSLTDDGLRAGTAGAARVELTDTGLTAYDATNAQTVDLDSATGNFTAGPVTLNQNGVQIEFGTGPSSVTRFIKWGATNQHHLGFYESGSHTFGYFQNGFSATGRYAQVLSQVHNTDDSVTLYLLARARSTGISPPVPVGIQISQYPSGGNSGKIQIIGGPLELSTSINSTGNVNALNGSFSAGLNVGSATGAATGEVKASASGSFAGGLNVGAATGAATGEIKASGPISGASGAFTGDLTVGSTSGGLNVGTTGATAGQVKALSAAITNALTAASASLTGDLTVGSSSGGLNVGTTGATAGQVKALSAAITNALTANSLAATTSVSGASGSFTGSMTVGSTSGGLNVGTTGATAGQVKALSAAITNALTAASASLTGDLTVGSSSGGLNVGTTGATAGQVKALSAAITNALTANSVAATTSVSGASGSFTGSMTVGSTSGGLNVGTTGAAAGEVKAVTLSLSGAATIGGNVSAANINATPGASRIVQADGAGKIASGWLPALDAWTVVGSGGGAPAFTNSWANLGVAGRNTASYYKDPLGYVHLRGIITGGTIGLSAFQLPVGYRPQNQEIRPGVSNNVTTNIFARIDIAADGTVIPTTGGSSWFSLDGISFRAV